MTTLIVKPAQTIISLAALLLLSVHAAPQVGAQSAGNKSPPSYCGVHSLFRAMRALGKEVDFSALLRPEYIGSPHGSSVAELQCAAEDFGLHARAVAGLTCNVLLTVGRPVLLHVKRDFDSDAHRHWVLFMGIEDGKARIYDGVGDYRLVEFTDLSAIWDGVALVVSDRPVPGIPLYTSFGASFLQFAGVFAALLASLTLLRHSATTASWARPIKKLIRGPLGDVLFIVVGTISSVVCFSLVNESGYLSSIQAINAIQDRHLSSFLPSVSIVEVESVVSAVDSTIVDARLPEHFAIGHIPNARNLPVTSGPKKFEGFLKDVPKERRLVVYCQSNGCPWSAIVAKKLMELGYADVRLYRGGWTEWEKVVEGQH